jgi:asparagine synthase (glutamine-hydrolysing)
MANFVICVDEDTGRRRRFVEVVQNRLPPFRGLVMGTISSREFDATWAADPRAPLAHVSDEESTTILFGEMITHDGRRIDPATLRDRWSEPIVERIHADLDGYYAGCVYLPGRRLLVGADLLGLFPIYYYGIDDVVLVGSSPATFASHPCFRSTFNPTGLVGLLLTNGLFDGQTLLAGVRRLAPGHLLVWEHGAPLREVPYYRTPFSDRYLDLSFSSHLDILDEAMGTAIKRHVAPGRTYSLLLSGGLDSRTIGGYLEQAGREAIALTLGTPTDIEVQCATRVARSLGMRQHVREFDAGQYPDLARLHTTWEHCAAGSSLIMQWGMREILRDLPSPFVTGLGLDWVLGGHAPTEPGLSFDSFFRYQNVWGFAPDHLEALLRKEVFSDTVSTTMKRIQETYTSYSEVESRRAWSFSLIAATLPHRQPGVAAAPSRAGRLCWPPGALWRSAPRCRRQRGGSSGAGRAAPHALPGLAELPLDRNSVDTTPLLPGLRWLLGRRLRRPLSGSGQLFLRHGTHRASSLLSDIQHQ